MVESTILSDAMSNPYFWLIGFVLTVIGAVPGIVRIFRFLKDQGDDFYRWSLRRSVKATVVSAIEHVSESPQGMDGVLSYYTSRLSDMLLKIAGLVFNLLVAFYVMNFGFEPLSSDPSWRLFSIPFLIFSLINSIELWIIRFQIYMFRHALPAIREELEKVT